MTSSLWIALFRAVGTDRPSALSLLGSASWAFGSTIQRRLPLPVDVTVTTSYEMAFGGAFLIAAGWIDGESWQPEHCPGGPPSPGST